MKYTAIGFDYGGVIAGIPGPEFNRRVCEFLGITTNQYHSSYYKFNHLMNNGQISIPELWRMVLDDLNLGARFQEFIQFQSGLMRNEVHVEMLQLIDCLRQHGYKVGLLSNNTAEKGGFIRSSGIADHFDVCVISGEIGMSKPDPKIFEYFFAALDVSPHEAIYIDDAEKSLSTASEVGYHPILFENYNKLKLELVSLGLNVDQPR